MTTFDDDTNRGPDELVRSTVRAAEQLAETLGRLSTTGTSPLYLLAAVRIVLRDLEQTVEDALGGEHAEALLVAAATCAGQVPNAAAPEPVNEWLRKYVDVEKGGETDRDVSLIDHLTRTLAGCGLPRAEHLGILAAAVDLEGHALGFSPDQLADLIRDAAAGCNTDPDCPGT